MVGSELNRYVKQSLEMDYRLQDLRMTGEISSFRAYPSGHWYFTLKDGGAQVSCVMWRGRAERQPLHARATATPSSPPAPSRSTKCAANTNWTWRC